MSLPTLLNTRSPLASTVAQLAMLRSVAITTSFEDAAARGGSFIAGDPTVLQINVGKRCNQACHHCHVDAGPDRTEIMTDAVVDASLRLLEQTTIETLDITGGAPELHPRFREIVTRARALERHVMDRCNLTITTLPNYTWIPPFLATHRVEVVASLPSYAASQTDRQRGDGVFEQSLAALRRFNELGYGHDGSGLTLNLVTNPVGAFLPASQASLERDWKRELSRRYGIVFNRLFTITNMPIGRFLQWLERSGNTELYLTKLVNAFNPSTLDGLMCRHTLSVGWDGRLYDCDFNQMLDLGLESTAPQTILDALVTTLSGRRIVTGPHCFGCTAGSGSSCGGAVATARGN